MNQYVSMLRADRRGAIFSKVCILILSKLMNRKYNVNLIQAALSKCGIKGGQV